MIRIELDIPMPQACVGCFLLDDEFEYCHGHLATDCKELQPYLRTMPYTKPDWCPLVEVRKSCNECMLGAPYEICWQTQCTNYSFKKYKEEQWQNHLKECLEHLEKKYETQRNN